MPNLFYQKALEYTVRGYSIIPLKRDKTPLLKANKVFQRERQPTEEEIETWWKQNPEANIGICTGKISNLTIVDIDTSEGASVPLSTFPETFTVQTPTGGYHLYYAYDPDIKQTANTYQQFPHLDIRNDGGYVVASPSYCEYTKNGKKVSGPYTVIKALPIAPFPHHLFITKSLPKRTVNNILKEFPKMADGDGRNNALTSVIGKIMNVVSPQDYESIGYPIALAANNQFKRPLLEREVRTIFDSIKSRQLKKPLAEIEFLKNDKGIINNEENIYRTIKADISLANQFRYNIFQGFVESKFNKNEWEPLQRVDVVNVRTYLMRTYQHFTKVLHTAVEDSIVKMAYENKVSPPIEYFKSLVWDKTPRLDTWLSKTYNVEENEYHTAIGSNWVKGMVKRLVYPGCKFDYVLVLEGKQGIKKSTSLSILGGSWHVETIFTPDNKDFFMLFGGKAIVEFSEGETLSRTEAKHLKAVITMQYDKYRPPYDRSPRDFPRQCVFAMTTNQEQYLKDETGNRRWLPIACKGVANIDWLKENRDQLFAEAYHRVITLNETIHEFPVEAMAEQQEMREITDPRTQQVIEWYYLKIGEFERNDGVTTKMAYDGAILKGMSSNFSGKEMTKIDEMVIGSIFRDKMKLERKQTTKEGLRAWRYFSCEESMKLAPNTPTQLSADEVLSQWEKI